MGQELLAKIRTEMNRVFVGKEELIDNILICLLAGGHVLLEDVPGVGKTTLARTLAQTIGADMGRLQFTPDTLPGDVLGVNIYNMKTGEFEYREGESAIRLCLQMRLTVLRRRRRQRSLRPWRKTRLQ